MKRTLRGPVVAFVALALALSATVHADAAKTSRVLPRPEKTLPTFTHSEAQDVLADAKSKLRKDTLRQRSRETLGNGPDTDITMTLRDLSLARSELSGAERREADAILARPSDNLNDDYVRYPSDKPTTPRRHYCRAGQVVCVHWIGGATSPQRVNRTDSDSDGVPDYVETVYDTMLRVWNTETGTLGFKTPLPDSGTSTKPDNPDGRVDIYLADLRVYGLYGYCAPDDDDDNSPQQAGYCVLDNDYVDYGTAPFKALRATAAHEFFHTVQFAYDIGEERWFMEGSATWAEDEVFDAVNDNYQFLSESPIRYPREPLNSESESFQYGTFIFFKYAGERRGVSTVRKFWESAEIGSRTALQAIYGVVGASTWTGFFTTFGSWNTLPLHSYSERAGYPPPAWWLKKTLTSSSPTTGWKSTGVTHLATAPTLLTPGSTLSPSRRILVEVDAPNRSTGSAALLQRRFRDGHVTHTMISLNASGNASTLAYFNRKTVSGIAVIMSNTSRYSPSRPYKVRVSLR